jgi:hypothetical protein
MSETTFSKKVQPAVQQMTIEETKNQLKSISIQTQTTTTTPKSKLKNEIKTILKYSTLAYLLAPFRSKRYLIKLTWFLFLMIILFGSTFYIILSILDFLSYDTITTIRTINEDQSQFPTISFCNKNNSEFKFDVLKLGFNSDDIGDWQTHFETYNDTSFGKCFKFNSGKNMTNEIIPFKYSHSPGIDDGFTFSFYFKPSSDFDTLRIFIHNYTLVPSTIAKKGYTISSGGYNYYIVERIIDKKLEYPYNNCLNNISTFQFNKTIINYILEELHSEYSQLECNRMCKNLKFIESNNECNCSLNTIGNDIKNDCQAANKTEKAKSLTCIKFYLSNFKTAEQCSQFCPLECNSYSFQVTPFVRPIIDTGNISLDSPFPYPNFGTYENVSKTFFSIKVYYENLKYTLIDQHPKTELFALIAEIGGIMGVFLGFSIISVIELFELFYELFHVYLINNK